MMKKILSAAALAMMVLSASFSAYAGQWEQDTQGWRWKDNDGSFAAKCWRWLDGNQDGISECYYFYEDGYMASKIPVSDGSYINENGAWVSDGEVQIVKESQYHEDPVWIEENLEKDAISGQITGMINQERIINGQEPLLINPELVAGAEVRARELSQKEGHTRPDGSRYSTVITVEYTMAGENYAISYTPSQITEGEDAAQLVAGWLTSSINRTNFLSEKWQETGVGVYITGNCISVGQFFL